MSNTFPPRVDIEECSRVFTKFHVRGPWPFHPVFHRMTEADKGFLPHDHPFGFNVYIIEGGYVEEVYAEDGSHVRVTRNTLDSFVNPAGRVHRIVELLAPEVWTMILPHAHERKESFYLWKGGNAFRCHFGSEEWVDVQPGDITPLEPAGTVIGGQIVKQIMSSAADEAVALGRRIAGERIGLSYACGSCGTQNPDLWRACLRPDCPDGRDQPRRFNP